MRITITCEECGAKHLLERPISEPGPIWIVCHRCEMPLQAVLSFPDPVPTAVSQAWGAIIDFPQKSSPMTQ